MSNCPRCAYEHHPWQKYCPKCGANLSGQDFRKPSPELIFPQNQGIKKTPEWGMGIVFLSMAFILMGVTSIVGIIISWVGIRKASNSSVKMLFQISLGIACVSLVIMLYYFIQKIT